MGLIAIFRIARLGQLMNEVKKNIWWLVGFVVFSACHFGASYFAIEMAFGFGMAESTLAIPFGVIAIILNPMFFLGEVFLNEIDDNTAVCLTIFLNGVMWWCLVIFTMRWRKRRRTEKATKNSSQPELDK